MIEAITEGLKEVLSWIKMIITGIPGLLGITAAGLLLFILRYLLKTLKK